MSYLPELYQEFKQHFPEAAKAYDAIAASCHQWEPLDEKTRRLIKSGIAIGLSSEGEVKSHTRRVLEESISPDELRYCGAHNISNLQILSDHREASFGTAYGVLIKELRLLSRAIFVVDGNDTVRYVEYVKELASHPDYEKALDALKSA